MTFMIKRSEKNLPKSSGILRYPSKFTLRSSLKIVGGFIATLSSVVTLTAFFGWKALLGCAILGIIATSGLQLLRMSQRIQKLERSLFAELPHQHKFLIEFLRTTYIASGQDRIVERNKGLAVYLYENNFSVRGSDCSNSQVIKGRNISEVPVRGVSFALVGGSSMNVGTLGSKYKTNDGASGSPEFLIDDDRFKVAFCPFNTPLRQNCEFITTYADEWKGAMREEADGFFFPEALYFPDKIGELSSRLDFNFIIDSLAALEVDIKQSIVRTCNAQPVVVEPADGFVCAYQWRKLAPSPNSIFVLYYRAK